LKTAWARLKHLDLDGDGCISPGELVRQFQVQVERGSQTGLRGFVALPAGFNPTPPIRPAGYPAGTPLWFKKMDRHVDGDVSFREFLGTREEFNRIDTDGDGLISPEEAMRFQPPGGKQGR